MSKKAVILLVLPLVLILWATPMVFGAKFQAEQITPEQQTATSLRGAKESANYTPVEAVADEILAGPVDRTKDFCDLYRSPAFYITDWFYGLEWWANYQDPEEFGCVDVWPFEVTQICFSMNAPDTMTFLVTGYVLENVGTPSCPLPGGILCQTPVYQVYVPSAGHWHICLSMTEQCCVNEPYFAAIYIHTDFSSMTDMPDPVSENDPTDVCRSYNDYGFGWEDLVVQHGWPGEMILNSVGFTSPQNDCPAWPNHKMHFPQLPDLIGWDVLATYPKILADDWQCSRTGPVEDIHFWGSWKNLDGMPGTDEYYTEMPWFLLSIHANIPADADTPWSRPGRLLWLWEGEIPGTPFDPPTLEAWYDPNLDTSICNDHIPYWQYDFYVDQVYPPPESLFIQYKDSIYWLNISALNIPYPYQWGWKNSRDHFMDDAVYRDEAPPFLGWQPMIEPPRCNWFDVGFDSYGTPDDMYSTNYYGDGWYEYEYWWNMWFYDNPFVYRPKEIFIDRLWVAVVGTNPYAEFAINYSTPAWDTLGMGRPPLPEDGNEELYIERQIVGPLPMEMLLYYTFTIPYNPEWVSIDFVATDVVINGWIYHECVETSLDLAFVITGGEECTPSVDVEKRVWDEENEDWVDSTDIDSCTNANFLITIHNDGTCCDLTDIVVTDFMDASLEYLTASPPPDYVDPTPTGTLIGWVFPGPLEPCNTIEITVVAHVIGPPCHTDSNSVDVNAFCEASGVDVNDYDVAYVHATQPVLDFGDAPDPTYPTLLATGGARHVIVPNIFLGASIDPEPDGQPSVDALGDDNDGNDDEDGVVFLNLVNPGGAVTVKVTASVAGFLDGWVDFNFNGVWDAAEQVFVSAPVVAGVNILTFNVPTTAPAGITYSRFRFSTAGGLAVTGLANDGEVEDYRVFVLKPIENIKMHWPQWPDLDNTGMDVDMAYSLLGDDWMCTKTAPVNDIHFWGSFADDILPADGPGALTFYVGIWSDFPGPPSTPAAELWFRNFVPGTYTVHQVADNNPEDWFDPVTGLWINDDHLQIYQYDFFIDEDYFEQDSGSIYWLAIWDLTPSPHDYTFGWKTTEIDLQYRDDACYYAGAGWTPMFYPDGHEYAYETLDLAFVITGEEVCTPSIDVEKTVWDETLIIWVDSTDIDVCDSAEFRITIHNDGTCCDLTNIIAEDFMDSSLEFLYAYPPPDTVDPVPGGTHLEWSFPGPLSPCNTIEIRVIAHVVGPPCHLDSNYVWAQGDCEEQAVSVYDEDVAYVHATAPPLDFGDAPDPTYPTLLANDGARHVIVPNIFLGVSIDPEPNGQPTATALGDDNDGNDDEDGVVFTSLAVAGNPVTVKVTASVAGALDAWVDFNVDGDWADAGEQIFVSTALNPGVNILTFNVPTTAPAGITYSRFRFSTAGGLGYTGLASDGEVEDYRVFVLEPITDIKMHWPQWPDLDNTGMDIDMAYPLGDDWFCTQTGPVKDIHFWGSFAEDILPADGPGSLTFGVTIWSDNPGPPSTPESQLWIRSFGPGQYTVHQVADNNPEDWFDPWTGLWINDDHLQIYQYDFFIDEDYFVQEEGTVYWLVIKDMPPPYDYTFGWKTAEFELRYRDDAVYMLPPPWLPMFYPPGHEYVEESLDLAFVITGPECTPSIDVEKRVWDEANEDWVDSTDIDSCSNAEFLITIHNDGTCCDLTEILVSDCMDSSLDYQYASPPPDSVEPYPGGVCLEWHFPGPIPPCSTIEITVTFHAVGPVCHVDTNYVGATGFCESTGQYVNDEDMAWVHVTPPEWPNHKMHYPQLPDPEGWDVVATMPIVAADDFMCTKSFPITDIHFWGSWLNDVPGELYGFQLSIHANIPGPPSMPGEELWSAAISIDDIEVVPMDPSEQGWYDPVEPWYEHPNHDLYYRYDITNIPNPFCQDSGTIYWLNIIAAVIPGYPIPPLWGWKTSLDHWQDDAVWANLLDYDWHPLYDPITTETLDLAFVITGEVECGDLTGDGVIDLGDVLFLISYLYKGGPAPCPLEVADVNCDGVIDLGDLLYLISYLYKGGPVPCDPDGDGIPDC